jgi:hypothetical protein
LNLNGNIIDPIAKQTSNGETGNLPTKNDKKKHHDWRYNY